MKAYLSLIKEALSQGFKIDVYSEEGIEIEESTSYKEVKDMVEALDDLPVLKFWDSDRVYRGFAQINLFVDDDETVMDHSMNHTKDGLPPEFTDTWIVEWWNKTIN